MERKKIIFVVPDMAGGGTEKVISLLADEYVREGIEVGILLFAGNDTAYPLDERVEVYSAGNPSGGSALVRLKRIKNMRNYFRRNRNAYIFSFSTIGTGFIVLSILSEFLTGRRKMLVSERTDPQTCDHKPYRNFFYRFCKVLVCQTKEAVQCFPKYLNKKAVVVANPMDPALPEVYKGSRSKRIVTVGRLQPVKNQKMLLDSYAAFGKEYPEYTLHLYGKSREASWACRRKLYFMVSAAGWRRKRKMRQCLSYVPIMKGYRIPLWKLWRWAYRRLPRTARSAAAKVISATM